MPGGFVDDPREDGGWATTESGEKCGFVGRNNYRLPANAPGGSGLFGLTTAPGAAGVFGSNNAVAGNRGCGVQGNGPEAGVAGWSENGTGIVARSGNVGLDSQAPIAAIFTGEVQVDGDIKLIGADCAEEFDVIDAAEVEPGTVMVLQDGGRVGTSDRDYDTRVVGVVSGAGSFQPALVMDRQASNGGRLPVALMGKVYCKVDAMHVPVAVGDLLTTSATPGHAMKAVDQQRAFGAVVGKALEACTGRRQLIPILVALQ